MYMDMKSRFIIFVIYISAWLLCVVPVFFAETHDMIDIPFLLHPVIRQLSVKRFSHCI